ncbi:MAG TPA: hypothetical protein VFS87_03790 [Qipengyuania sp.]|nr:hypothetical protein [Qipengyuania sp.]
MDQVMEDAEPVAATNHDAAQGAPWHLWAVGGVSLLWNAFGATDYTMSQLRNRDYLGGAAESMGITVDQMIAYIDSFPGWMHAFWALGVWGAFIGSILLLLRKRHAVWAFGLSLLGLAVTQFYQAFTPQPAWSEGALVMNLVIWSIATFLLIYAVSMRNKGVLR